MAARIRIRRACCSWLIGLVAVIAGCGKGSDPGKGVPESPPPASIPAIPGATPADPGPPRDITPPPALRLDDPFTVAVTLAAPEGSQLPPPTTPAGKSTAALREAVQQAWPTIALTDATGKPVPAVVTFDTDIGPVEVTLDAEKAPNHTRNLLALVKLGYYDGLLFERVVRDDVTLDNGATARVELVTLGCPAGDGEPGHGHLGYFLRPEVNTLRHETGTVGFVRSDDPNSACCRLYICLAPCPLMDGQFTAVGKVTHGMDVVKAIAARPVKDPNTLPESELPREPVKIRKAARR